MPKAKKPPVVEPLAKPPKPSRGAAGSASQTSTATADVSLGTMIEGAMAQAVIDTQTDSEAIWADAGLSDEEKKKRIAALNDPAAVRERMMQYRDRLRTDWYAAAAKVPQ